MTGHIVSTLKSTGIEYISLISNQPELYESLGLPIHGDIIPNKGPLSGLHAGLLHSEVEHNIVLGCDTPLIDAQILNVLIDQYKPPATILKCQNIHHPLVGIYSNCIMDALTASLEANEYKMMDLIKRIEGKIVVIEDYLDEDCRFKFMNVNLPDQFAELQKIGLQS